jgi:hypothetical protein
MWVMTSPEWVAYWFGRDVFGVWIRNTSGVVSGGRHLPTVARRPRLRLRLISLRRGLRQPWALTDVTPAGVSFGTQGRPVQPWDHFVDV